MTQVCSQSECYVLSSNVLIEKSFFLGVRGDNQTSKDKLTKEERGYKLSYKATTTIFFGTFFLQSFQITD